MTLIRWTPKLAVGAPEIDRQHQHLIDLINRLCDNIIAGKGREVFAAILEELERHTEMHFAHEEQLMDAHAYANTESHKAEHRSMLDEFHRYCDECVLRSGNPKVLLGYLEHWFMRHIDDADRHFGAALARGGT